MLRGREQSAWPAGGAGGALLLTAPAPQRVSVSRVPVCGSWLAVVPDPSARHAASWEKQGRHPLRGSRPPPACHGLQHSKRGDADSAAAHAVRGLQKWRQLLLAVWAESLSVKELGSRLVGPVLWDKVKGSTQMHLAGPLPVTVFKHANSSD